MKIHRRSFGSFDLIQITNSSGNYVEIIPEVGCLINSLNFEGENIFDNYEGEKDLNENLHNSYKGAFLSPYPNRIEGGQYEFEGIKHQLHIDFPNENNSIHGLITKAPFTVRKMINRDQESVVGLIYNYEGDKPGYPFKYQITKIISFSEEDELKIRTKIINYSSTSIPIGDGWHPYIKTGSSVDDIELQFSSQQVAGVNDVNIPTGKFSDFKEFNSLDKIGNREFDHCFVLKSSDDDHSTILKDFEKEIKVEVIQDANCKYLQIYTPPGRNSIAIEPMTCMPNAFNNKMGLMVLEPEEEKTINYGIRISRLK